MEMFNNKLKKTEDLHFSLEGKKNQAHLREYERQPQMSLTSGRSL